MTADVGVHAVHALPRLPNVRMRLPIVAVPTLLVFTGSLALGGFAAWLSLAGLAPAWATVPLHTAAIVGMFVVLHECTHHTAGRLTWVNSTLGRLAMPFVSFLGAFPSARHLHLAQHREGTAHLTPWDVRGPGWQLPLRWLVVDVWHLLAYLRRTARRPQLEVAETLVMLALLPGVLVALAGLGHGWRLVVVYLLSQRLALGLVAWWHDWRPRSLRPGAHSYQQAHSTSPGLPFYRYLQAWRAPEDETEPAPADRAGEFRRLTVTEVWPLTDKAVLVTFDVPHELRTGFAFQPGQHVELRTVVGGEELRRRYMICSWPGADGLRVAIKRNGPFSSYATTSLRPGDQIDVRPPAGRPTLAPGVKHVVGLAAGAGIVQVLPMLVHGMATAPRFRATLLYVNRSGDDTMFAAELKELTRRFDGRLQILHFRTDERDPDLWAPRPGRRPFESIAEALAISDERYYRGGLDAGRFRQLLDSRLHPAKVDEWLLSAPPGLAGLAQAILAEHHVPTSTVHIERF
ncbi:MAG TPA: FAD-binding oxidoreductase [Amycolatopsis sp.]|uniref:FAD-binding oxidoreductase n=1 Tax=Amycolatopsis sp. TaxID=37632 RepID=UPI002B4607E6|nr:FAD-binding oxidoreductase [Amycolatopsis sp.]HKS47714.1 FAD-binding oxidoreductase [Amycolatopsis sp.]